MLYGTLKSRWLCLCAFFLHSLLFYYWDCVIGAIFLHLMTKCFSVLFFTLFLASVISSFCPENEKSSVMWVRPRLRQNVRYIHVSQSVLVWTSRDRCYIVSISIVHIDSFHIKLKMLLAKRRQTHRDVESREDAYFKSNRFIRKQT